MSVILAYCAAPRGATWIASDTMAMSGTLRLDCGAKWIVHGAWAAGVAGYLLLCLALVFGLARLIHNENAWIWIAAAAGVLHLAGAWGILNVARGWLQKPMFGSTLEEFRKDDAWLKSTAAKPH